MHWYIHVLKNYVAFSGRARRKEYWYFTLFYALSLVLAVIFDLFTGTLDDSIGFGWISGAYFIATLLPALAVSVRRLHDIGRSGWWMLLLFVPLVGSVILLVLATFNGQPGPNAFGPDPKATAGTKPVISGPMPNAGWEGPPVIKTVRILVMLALVAVVLSGAGWFWWQTHREVLIQAHQQGARSGGQFDERDCLETAVDHIRASQRSGFETSVVEGTWLGGCLKASRVAPSFCEGVPPSSSVLTAAGWITSQCAHLGLAGQACPGVLQQVVSHCTLPRRAAGERT